MVFLSRFILMFSLLAGAPAMSQFFDEQGKPLSPEIFRSNPQGIPQKTNLKIVSMSTTNPFEWAHVTYSQTYPCTGGVITLPGYKPTDKALVLTAGHCIRRDNKYLGPKEVILNMELTPNDSYLYFPRERKFWLTNSDGQKIESSSVTFNFSKILFASFDFVDIALLEMDLTYADLIYPQDQTPPMLATSMPQAGERIRAFGIPDAEVYRSRLFHQSECNVVEKFTHLSIYKNTGMAQEFTSIKSVLTNCTLLPGMSGGYVRNSEGLVLGVNGGNNLEGSDGVVYTYFQPTYPLASCADGQGGLKTACLQRMAELIKSWDYQNFEKEFTTP